MKKTTKLLVLVLSFALIFGTVFAFTASAEETQNETSNKTWVVSKNVSYEENTHLFFAIDASVAADSTKLSLSVLDDAGNVLAEGLKVSDASVDIYGDGSMIAHVIKTPGVAAKDFADVLTIAVYYDGSENPVETTTYSVAEYFLERLYKDEVINATEGAAVAKKKLYLASLRYGAAAQSVLAPTDIVKVDDLIYVETPSDSGVVSKGYTLKLDSSTYRFDYYSNTEKNVEYDIAGAVGYYVLDESVKVTKLIPSVVAPAGAATFENLTVSDTDLGGSKNETYLPIAGAVDGATGLTSVGSWSQDVNWQNVTVGVDDKGNRYIRSEVTQQNGKNSHTIEVVRDTSSEGDVLVFQARMRINPASDSEGNNQVRVYKGRTDGNGARLQFETMTSAYSGGWFTYRVVFTNNGSGGVDYKLYKAKDAASMVGAKPTKSGTVTLNSGSAGSITELNNFTMMLSVKFAGTLDWDYVFFTTVSDLDAVDALVETEEEYDATLAPDYMPYESNSFAEHVILSGATLHDAEPIGYTGKFASVKEENGNKYVSFTDTNSTGMAQLQFKNTNDLTDMDTLTLKVDLRFTPHNDIASQFYDNNSAIQIRLRNSKSAAHANTAQIYLYVENGMIKIYDENAGTRTLTNISAFDWFTVSISYTSNSATSHFVISDGVNSTTIEAATHSADHQVPISELATSGMSVYTNTGLICIWDIDNVSITASKSAN